MSLELLPIPSSYLAFILGTILMVGTSDSSYQSFVLLFFGDGWASSSSSSSIALSIQ
jgi:hypothetical protein